MSPGMWSIWLFVLWCDVLVFDESRGQGGGYSFWTVGRLLFVMVAILLKDVACYGCSVVVAVGCELGSFVSRIWIGGK